MLFHIKVIIRELYNLEIFRLHTFACKSDNWRSVENRITYLAYKSDNWKVSKELYTYTFRLHTFAKSDNGEHSTTDLFRLHHFYM